MNLRRALFKPDRKVSVLIALASAFTCLPAMGAADDPDAVVGRWASSGTIIEVAVLSDTLSAKLIALKHPLYREKDDAGVVGEPKLDTHNPIETLRDRPMLGMELLSDFSFKKKRWNGDLYLPENGKTFRSKVWVKDGDLKIRGYVGLSMFGSSKTFVPLSVCNENIVKMIKLAKLEDTGCEI